MRHALFDKRELVTSLWAFFRGISKEDHFFDVLAILASIEEDLQYAIDNEFYADLDVDRMRSAVGNNDAVRNGR